jgi:hypothetical protein
MAKKKPQRPAKRPQPKPAQPKQSKSKPPPQKVAPPTISVFFELRDVAGIRHHSDHADIHRARIAAQMLVTSSDINQAWVLRDVEIFTLTTS